MVEEIGADAYVFCVAQIAGDETKLVARCTRDNAHRRKANGCTCGRQAETCTSSIPESGARLPA